MGTCPTCTLMLSTEKILGRFLKDIATTPIWYLPATVTYFVGVVLHESQDLERFEDGDGLTHLMDPETGLTLCDPHAEKDRKITEYMETFFGEHIRKALRKGIE